MTKEVYASMSPAYYQVKNDRDDHKLQADDKCSTFLSTAFCFTWLKSIRKQQE